MVISSDDGVCPSASGKIQTDDLCCPRLVGHFKMTIFEIFSSHNFFALYICDILQFFFAPLLFAFLFFFLLFVQQIQFADQACQEENQKLPEISPVVREVTNLGAIPLAAVAIRDKMDPTSQPTDNRVDEHQEMTTDVEEAMEDQRSIIEI